MPWEAKRIGENWCSVNKDTGKSVACFGPNGEEKAKMHVKALYANTKEKMEEGEHFGLTLLRVAYTNEPHLDLRKHPISILEIDGQEYVRHPILVAGHYRHPNGTLNLNTVPITDPGHKFNRVLVNHYNRVTQSGVYTRPHHQSREAWTWLSTEHGGWLTVEEEDGDTLLVGYGRPTSEQRLQALKQRDYLYTSADLHLKYRSNRLLEESEDIISWEQLYQDDEVIELFNPNRDRMGRFASGTGRAVAAVGKGAARAAAGTAKAAGRAGKGVTKAALRTAAAGLKIGVAGTLAAAVVANVVSERESSVSIGKEGIAVDPRGQRRSEREQGQSLQETLQNTEIKVGGENLSDFAESALRDGRITRGGDSLEQTMIDGKPVGEWLEDTNLEIEGLPIDDWSGKRKNDVTIDGNSVSDWLEDTLGFENIIEEDTMPEGDTTIITLEKSEHERLTDAAKKAEEALAKIKQLEKERDDLETKVTRLESRVQDDDDDPDLPEGVRRELEQMRLELEQAKDQRVMDRLKLALKQAGKPDKDGGILDAFTINSILQFAQGQEIKDEESGLIVKLEQSASPHEQRRQTLEFLTYLLENAPRIPGTKTAGTEQRLEQNGNGQIVLGEEDTAEIQAAWGGAPNSNGGGA